MTRQDVINHIERYAEATGLKPSTICQYAITNRKFYDRMVAGYFHEERAKRLVDWMNKNAPEPRA